MPYIADQNEIYTKLVEVTRTDSTGGRQQALLDMRNAPESVERIYISGLKVFVSFDSGKVACIGLIQSKYLPYLREWYTELDSWKITGGDAAIEGYDYGDRQLMKNLGINIHIKLIKKRT